MKQFLLLFWSAITLIFICCLKSAPPPVVHTSHYKYVTKSLNGDNSVFINSASPKDTFVFRASLNPYSNAYFGGISGNSTDSITMINEGGQVYFYQGIKVENCNYFTVDGTGDAGTYYGFKVVNGSTVPGVITGTSNDISWHNTDMSNLNTGNGAFWCKEEVSDAQNAGCPAANGLIFPNKITNINFYNNYVHNSGGDVYFGSTGSLGGRIYTDCNGNTNYTTKPMWLANVKIWGNIIDSLGRSFQLSGCLGGHIWNNTITHTGYEYQDGQGYGIGLGDGDSDIEVDHNIVKDNWMQNIWFVACGNKNKIHDNNCDSAGWFDATHHHSGVSSMLFSSHSYPTTWDIENNVTGLNTSTPSTGIALYNDKGYSTNNNILCGNTGFIGNCLGGSQCVTYSGCSTPTYNITSSAGANGSISPNGITAVTAGTDQSYTFTPNTGYKVLDVLVNGTSQGAINSYTFYSVNSVNIISVSFVAVSFTPPVAHAGKDTTIIKNSTINLYGSATVGSGSISTIKWTSVGGLGVTLSNDASYTSGATFSQSGTVKLKLKVKDVNGLSATDIITVTIIEEAGQTLSYMKGFNSNGDFSWASGDLTKKKLTSVLMVFSDSTRKTVKHK